MKWGEALVCYILLNDCDNNRMDCFFRKESSLENFQFLKLRTGFINIQIKRFPGHKDDSTKMHMNIKDVSQKELNQLISEAKIPTIVSALDHASAEHQCKIFNLLSASKAEKVFIYLEPVSQAHIIQKLEKRKALAILEKMEPDDRARLFKELPDKIADRFLKRLSFKERHATALLLEYPEETAGRIMSPFFISLRSSMSVEQALEKIRQEGEDAETIYVLPVVDDNSLLKGIVELDRLVMSNPDEHIADLMSKEVKSFSAYEDQEKVARFIQSTDKLAVPIVDEEMHLMGIVTIDDAMDIMQQEETEDIILGGASEPLRKPYLSVSIFRLMRVRVIWLLFLALAGTLTVNVLNAFEATLNEGIVLALFIPLLIGIGGNTGSQSATIIVRALAMDHVRIGDFIKVVARETAVGILLGMILGAVGYVFIWAVFQQNIALVVSLSVIAICTVAALTGSIMPILARIMHLDPAVVSTPFVSTVIDATGLLIYFMIARMILHL
ncbi:Magnesium transporter mgtE [Legionella israelensis]|uniref:Magnesium transporter MgtE n=3 Tax=Legionella israelensis TaxID=454 RepID=A0A0W0WQE3_9GAMM|nr:Magnesium transporter MgtE [Legionella israelensis]QBS09221.1 magnesium transporter [Legionella israelensis]SCX98844.1 magnesium transporter [Legionella israelensis DSM 19235]STX58964.1 Magnesium transporter mgtE [Legionella israelensis]